MKYEVVIEDMATEDLSDLLLYETAYTHSVSRARERLSNLVMTACEDLAEFPDRHAEKAYGFTDALRRKHGIGKYAVFYWIEKDRPRVRIERFVHTKADFNRIHFGN